MSFSAEVKDELKRKRPKEEERAYIRDVFLTSGTISDPNKSYRFEIVSKNEDEAQRIVDVLQEYDIKAGITTRKNNYVVYCTDGEDIADILSVMEAHKSRMTYENVKIVKGVRENINRKVNCETANITKTINASIKQIEDIRYIEEHVGLSNLPETLEEMARVRLEYPDTPLQELGEYLAQPIGKSGVNHRLRRISKFAEELRRTHND